MNREPRRLPGSRKSIPDYNLPCHYQDSRWTFAFWLTEFLRLRGQLIRTGPWSSLINDGVNMQVFLLKNRKVGAGRLQSIRRIYRHSWKNSVSCCALENQVTSKRACAVMTGFFVGSSFVSNHSATKPGRSLCGTE